MKIFQRSLMALCLAALAVSGAAAQQPTTPPPQKPTDAVPPPQRGPSVTNVRIDFTLTDQREGGAAIPKTLTMIVTDRDPGRMRTGSGRADGMLNVDVRPEIVRENRVRLSMTLEYRPALLPTDKDQPNAMTQSLSTILDDGKPLLVSQSADPGSSRTVKVEVKATILK